MSQYKNIRGYLMKLHILAEQQILSTCGYLGCLADKCDEVGAHSCTNIGVNWRTFSRSSFTTCASSSTQAWAANGLARTSIAKRQGTPCRLSNAHFASDCTRQRSVRPNKTGRAPSRERVGTTG